MKTNQKKFWEAKNAAKDTGELYIYGDIVSYKWDDTDITAADFKKDLEGLGDIKILNIYINSPGGSVFQGQAIHTILKRHPAVKNVYIDGVAASIASVIAMAGDTVLMPKNAMMMLHNPWTIALGNAQELRKVADDLDKIGESILATYLDKVEDKLTEEKLKELLDEETWLTAQECFDYGFCDKLLEEKEIAASLNAEILSRYKNVPQNLQKLLAKGEDVLTKEMRDKITEETKANIERMNKILGGM